MAQLRQDNAKFAERDTAVVVVGPDNARAFAKYFTENDLPFTGIPDPRSEVLKKFGQEVNIFKLGRMPAQVLVDRQGTARFVHYGHSMSDIPANDEILALIDEVNATGSA